MESYTCYYESHHKAERVLLLDKAQTALWYPPSCTLPHREAVVAERHHGWLASLGVSGGVWRRAIPKQAISEIRK
jgi:hypothetical protein